MKSRPNFSPDPRIIDDLARVAGGAVNILSGLQQQIRDDAKARIEDMATRLDLVPREDHDAALAQIDQLRSQVRTLDARLSQLEGKKSPSKKSKSTKKS